MKAIVAIKEHPFRFAALFIFSAFIFSHSPFFLWLGLPAVFPDTFDYFNTADILLHRPLSELGKVPIEIPPGYPVFLLLCSAICNKLMFIVTVQSLYKLAACLFLAYTCCKYYRYYGALVGIGLAIYIMNGFTIQWNTSISTESIYSSSLILFTALLIIAVYKGSRKWFWIIGIWLLVFPFVRPNGTYIYFFIPVFFAWFFATKKPSAFYVAILLPAVVFNIAWAAFNLQAYNRFVPGNFIRFTDVLRDLETPTDENHRKSGTPLQARLGKYMNLPALPPFYTDLWANTYKNMYVYRQMQDTTYKMYDSYIPISSELRQMVYKEFYNAPDRFAYNYQHLRSEPGIKGLWINAYLAWWFIDEAVFRNLLLFLVYVCITLFAWYKIIRSRLNNQVYLLLAVISSLHLLSIFVVSITHQSVQFRYTQVSEFIIYVTFALSPLLVLKNKTVENA